MKKNKLAVVAAIWILFIILVAATADLWVPQTLGDPNATGANMAAESRLAPSLEHPFGTDSLGRDVLSRVIYGARVYVYPENLIPTLTFNIFGLNVPVMRIIVIVSSLVLMLALYAFINRTRMGTAIRAVAIDQGAARLMGINVDRVISLVFFIGAGLGGVAGVMVGTYYGQIDFTMGWSYGLKAFTAAILGGIGNIPGAMIGGLLLGVIEALGASYLAMAWKDAIAFLVLILILIIRPTGLLGERVADKL